MNRIEKAIRNRISEAQVAFEQNAREKSMFEYQTEEWDALAFSEVRISDRLTLLRELLILAAAPSAMVDDATPDAQSNGHAPDVAPVHIRVGMPFSFEAVQSACIHAFSNVGSNVNASGVPHFARAVTDALVGGLPDAEEITIKPAPTFEEINRRVCESAKALSINHQVARSIAVDLCRGLGIEIPNKVSIPVNQ